MNTSTLTPSNPNTNTDGPWLCSDDAWDNTGVSFGSVSEFLSMCNACHGERPDLVQIGDDWIDSKTGLRVLERAA